MKTFSLQMLIKPNECHPLKLILQDSPFVHDLFESTWEIDKGNQSFTFTRFWYIEPFTWYETHVLLNINDQYKYYSLNFVFCSEIPF